MVRVTSSLIIAASHMKFQLKVDISLTPVESVNVREKLLIDQGFPI